jgi:phospholipase/lecithinase/hemolysin
LSRKKTLLSGLQGKPGFTYLEMAEQNDDLDFSDEVHPKPRVTPLWATQIAALLQGPRT